MEHLTTIPLIYLSILRIIIMLLSVSAIGLIFKYDMKKSSIAVGVPFVFGVAGVILFNIILLFGNERYHDVISIMSHLILLFGIIRWALNLRHQRG